MRRAAPFSSSQNLKVHLSNASLIQYLHVFFLETIEDNLMFKYWIKNDNLQTLDEQLNVQTLADQWQCSHLEHSRGQFLVVPPCEALHQLVGTLHGAAQLQ